MIRRAVTVLALTVLGAAALAVFRPAWATAVGLDLWNLPQLERRLAEQERRKEDLQTKSRVLNARIAAKEEVIYELLEERLTLLDAAGSFRRLDAETEVLAGRGSDMFPGKTEGERSCRQVIQWVRVQTQEWEPDRAEKFLARLEAELDAHLASHGRQVEVTED
jgi:hypothetical protein